jgi:hypothetical protein
MTLCVQQLNSCGSVGFYSQRQKLSTIKIGVHDCRLFYTFPWRCLSCGYFLEVLMYSIMIFITLLITRMLRIKKKYL